MSRRASTDTPGNGAECARFLNLTIAQCYNLANSGTIPAPDNGVWNIGNCAHAYIKYLQGRSGDEKRDYNVERTRLTSAQADKVEMEINVLNGKLLDAEVVEKVWSGMTSAARQRLLAIPYRFATSAMALKNFAEIETEAFNLISEALKEIHEYNPADYQPEKGVDVETAAPIDSDPVGRPGKEIKPRSKRGTRAVADK